LSDSVFLHDPAIVAAKAAMRVQMRARRKELIREHPEADWQAGDQAQALLDGLKLKRPGVAALYHASGAEMDPRPLAENLIKLGWSITLPACEEPDAPVVFRTWRPGDRLAPDAVGITSPLASAGEVVPDLVVVPLIAFDATGGRLGQGGGYYDRTLSNLRAAKGAPPAIGLAFAGQEVDVVPREDHDQKLDGVLTELGYRALR
jgi:5-formyltetrahydrofolate cyclo-ligase